VIIKQVIQLVDINQVVVVQFAIFNVFVKHQTNRQTDGRTDKQTNKQKNKQNTGELLDSKPGCNVKLE